MHGAEVVRAGYQGLWKRLVSLDPLQECIGQGLGNIASGLTGGMGGCAMIGQTQARLQIRTQWLGGGGKGGGGRTQQLGRGRGGCSSLSLAK